MQDPNEDTQWNDILRSKGILPPKEKEISEDDIVNMVESSVQKLQNQDQKEKEDMTLDELDELEDEEDERVLEEYRRKRIAEMKEAAERSKFGHVLEISAQDYVNEVNKAGEGIHVVLHLYKQGLPLCALLNDYLSKLAIKFPATKFLKSISTVCIPNYPDKNLPTVFIYFEGEMKSQLVGPASFRNNLSYEEFEYLLGQEGAVPSEIKEDPRPKVKDHLFSSLRGNDDGNNDWIL
ncbi:unnamed protein product [Bemisia tabaci]|uniref:Phosducin domain-containing protein n=1 Tax=Bemisia tabaci TaxID=7038 RepID=A0A9P0AEB5_BEMTA|nr:unnamed protein product [Bemisia tabaci]